MISENIPSRFHFGEIADCCTSDRKKVGNDQNDQFAQNITQLGLKWVNEDFGICSAPNSGIRGVSKMTRV